MASEQFGVLVRDFPVRTSDTDARMFAYLIWSAKVAEFGAVPVSGEADLDITEWVAEGDVIMVRVLGLAERG
jgi:hypothetical protein